MQMFLFSNYYYVADLSSNTILRQKNFTNWLQFLKDEQLSKNGSVQSRRN